MSKHNSSSHALLLEDVEGHSEQFADTVYPLLKQLRIPKGSLVESLPPSDVISIKEVYKFQANYSVYSSSPHVPSGAFLSASSNQLYNLTVKQSDLLLAVEGLTDRVEVLKKLDWIEPLSKGSRVYVTIDSKPIPVEGVVKHVGERSGLEGTRFEIEILDEKRKAVDDGSKQVEEKFIVSVSMDMLTDATTAVAAKPLDELAPYEKKPSVRICDYVTFRDVEDRQHRGTVRWIGTDKSVLPDGTTIVGIETEDPLNVTGIPANISTPPINDYFSVVNKGSKVFLPIYCVQREAPKKADNQCSNINRDDEKDLHGTVIEADSNDDEFHDALMDQTPETGTDSERSDKHHPDNFTLSNDDSNGSQISSKQFNLKVGSVVEYYGSCGVIQWMGPLPDAEKQMAGLVMDEDLDEDFDDGWWRGVQYYPCALKRGIFVGLKSLQPYSGPKKKLSQDNSPMPAENINDMAHSHRRLTDSPCSLPSSLNLNPHNLVVGSAIQHGNPLKYGVIKWIGKIPPRETLQYAGIEMDEYSEHATDGEWVGTKYFSSRPGRGKFVPLQTLQPDQRLQTSSSQKDQKEVHDLSPNLPPKNEDRSAKKISNQEQSRRWDQKIKKIFCGRDKHKDEMEESNGHEDLPRYSDKDTRNTEKPLALQQHKLEVGTAVQYDDPPVYGTIKKLFVPPEYGGPIARIEQEFGGISEVPLSELQPDGRFTAVRIDTTGKRKFSVETPALRQPQRYKLEVGTAVQYGDPPRYGTIKELFVSPVYNEQSARIEWEFGGKSEIRLSELQPDGRFIVDVNDTTGQSNPLEEKLYEHENEQMLVPPVKFDKDKHTQIKGIQGCQNSCYLDATLYGLFAFSDAFDFVFLDAATPNSKEQHVQRVLKNKIVYPLRVVKVVIQDSIQVLRTQLSDVQKIKGFTKDEKDPEEFLNLLFKHILHLDPFVHIRRPSGVDKEFLIQLFVTPVEGMSVVSTQQLLTKMFLEQNISFVKYPTRLLLQMPRYGKKFKSFQRIIPSLELDVKELCEARSGPCFVCGNQSNRICNDCSREPTLNTNTVLYFCDTCSPLWHKKPHRSNHNVRHLKIEPTDDFDTGKLQLLSVLCIETSHYVCFTRPTENDWVFFDSMADRLEMTGHQSRERYAILLEARLGYKVSTSWWEEAKATILTLSKGYDSLYVIAGSLLEILEDREVGMLADRICPPPNYKVLSDPSHKLHCTSEIVKELNYKQMSLLLAVKSCSDRIVALPKLEWVETLRSGSAAIVSAPEVYAYPTRVVVRYIGSLSDKEKEGVYFGVELLEQQYRGTTDGSYGEYKLFMCSPNCGLFVSMDKLFLHGDTSAKSKAITQHPSSSVDNDKPFKIGDKVLAYDVKGNPLKATVKWVGKNEAIIHGVLIVGMYSDTVIFDSRGRFPTQITRMDSLINPKPGHTRLFLPFYCVTKDVGDSDTASHGHDYYTRHQPNNSFFNHPSGGIRSERDKQQGISVKGQIEEQKLVNQEVKRNLEQGRKQIQIAESDKRRNKQLQIKKELQLHDIEGFDDTMLDPETQKKILEEIKHQRNEAQPKETYQSSHTTVNAYHGDQQVASLQKAHHQFKDQQYPTMDQLCQPTDQQGQPMYHYCQPMDYHIQLPQQIDQRPVMYLQRQSSSQHQSDFSKFLRAEEGPPISRLPQDHPYLSQRYRSGTGLHQEEGPSRSSLPMNEPHGFNQLPTGGSRYECEVGDAIQTGNPPHYGTVKYIGILPGAVDPIAGVEMEDNLSGATDGWHDGYLYFHSQPGRGTFIRLDALHPDARFVEHGKNLENVSNPLGPFYWNDNAGMGFAIPPVKIIEQLHTGIKKGIQGHQNSCYLDSTLFGLFAYSTVFDDLFLKESSDEIGKIIKRILLIIVNELRRDYVVHFEAIMVLRNELDKLQQLKGLKSEGEKDPEQFLNLLFKHVQNFKPFIVIKRPFGTDKEFFIQLFMKPDANCIPHTQELLCGMFKEQQLTFKKHPLRLLLRIPHYGKQFKSFRGVIPSLELDVKTLCEGFVAVAAKAYPCFVCNQPAVVMCEDCGKEEFKPKPYYYCQACTSLWHDHPNRQHHKPLIIQPGNDDPGIDVDDIGRLRLLSVLCIKKSHYVCFTNRLEGSGTNEWIFFDSMAERPDGVHYLPCVTNCTTELNEWVYGTKDLTRYTSKELPPLVRRFVEDAYLCIYVDHDGIMYGGDDDDDESLT